VSAQTESTYNWKTEQWSVPVNGTLAKLVKIGKVPVSLQGGVAGCGFGRLALTPTGKYRTA